MDVSAPQAPPSPNPANLALHRAIAYGAGPLLIIAGPGSGKKDSTWVIVEVKREHQLDDPVVKAKQDFAEQMATASRITYRIIGGQSVSSGCSALFE